MKDALVSIIIPSYNRAETIKESVLSVLHQTYENLEVIVVDDCSIDNTKEVVDSIADDRVRYIKLEKNSGACVARNVGVDNSRGDIIAFQDSDDKWHPDKLIKQVDYLIKKNYEFVTCGLVRISSNERKEVGIVDCPIDKVELWCKLLNNNWISTQTIVCYKYCFDKIRFDPKIRRYQDWDFALQAALQFKIGCLPECLVDVYLQENSITNTVKAENAKRIIIEKHKSDVDKNNSKMVAQYYKTFADVNRKRNSKVAAEYYMKCFKINKNKKVFLCWIACKLGIMKFYNSRM